MYLTLNDIPSEVGRGGYTASGLGEREGGGGGGWGGGTYADVEPITQWIRLWVGSAREFQTSLLFPPTTFLTGDGLFSRRCPFKRARMSPTLLLNIVYRFDILTWPAAVCAHLSCDTCMLRHRSYNSCASSSWLESSSFRRHTSATFVFR